MADRTVGHVFPKLAVVFIEEKCIDTHAAIVAMYEIISASDATESALFTVVRFLAVGHPNIAFRTMILSKLYTTVDAIIAVGERERERARARTPREANRWRMRQTTKWTLANSRLARLPGETFSTNHFLDSKSINVMMRFIIG